MSCPSQLGTKLALMPGTSGGLEDSQSVGVDSGYVSTGMVNPRGQPVELVFFITDELADAVAAFVESYLFWFILLWLG